MKKLNPFLRLTLTNIRLQHRHGFTAAWAVISVFYILGLYFLPDHITARILPLVLLSEPTTFAMIFTGAILLMERDEGLLDNLFITPLSVRDYMVSKALALSLPAVISTLVITAALTPFRWSLLIVVPGVCLTTLFFSVFTFIPASRCRDVMDLLGKIAVYGSVFSLPVLDYFGIIPGLHQYLFPSKGTLVLTSLAAGEGTFRGYEIILAFTSLVAGILIVIPSAEKSFRRNLILKGAAA